MRAQDLHEAKLIAEVGDEVLAPIDHADPIARRIYTEVLRMVEREVEQVKVPAPPMLARPPDLEIMRACRRVAEASDLLEQAKFSSGEIPARHALERAAKALRRVMRKYGRISRAEGSEG